VPSPFFKPSLPPKIFHKSPPPLPSAAGYRNSRKIFPQLQVISSLSNSLGGGRKSGLVKYSLTRWQVCRDAEREYFRSTALQWIRPLPGGAKAAENSQQAGLALPFGAGQLHKSAGLKREIKPAK